MRNAFNTVMQVVSTILGLLMICMGGIWILQGLNIAFLEGSFMAGDPQWAMWGALLALFGIGQVVWSVTRKRGAAHQRAQDEWARPRSDRPGEGAGD